MVVVEKDGRQRRLNSEVQVAAFLNSGWRVVSKEPRVPDAEDSGLKQTVSDLGADLAPDQDMELGLETTAGTELTQAATAPSKRGRK